jgi:pimeloyl-ACP methyl ester carboxylesterase
MNTHKVKGGGGAELHVVETGNPKGRPILFIHGFSQCCRSWTLQLNSDLADDFRLVAMDNRGHGLSDKPADAYGDPKLWADDVKAVIDELELDHPILSGWSYGSIIILDYIRHHGEDKIGGIHFIGGITKLGSEAAIAVIKPEFVALVPGFFSDDANESSQSLEKLINLCLIQKPSEEALQQMLEYSTAVPSFVRRGLFSRALDNDDLLPKIRKPVLITHGTDDAVVDPSVVDQHKALLPHAQIQMMANAGHAPFFEDPATFNRRLRQFAESI